MKLYQRKKKKELKNAIPPLEEIGVAASLHRFVASLFKESEELWKAWHIEFISDNGIVFATREVDDSCALKSFRLQLTVPALPKHVVSALLNHREKWDFITTSTKPTFIDISNKEDIAHIMFNHFNNTTVKKAIVARVWKEDEPGTGNAYVAEKSCKNDPLCVNVEIYHSAFIICPYKGKSIINYISRVDLKGKSTEWYDKTYQHLLISQMTRLAHLFKNMSD
uniref:START domain-containing protein n=1 Tax=Panagrolaimus sp. PS1159 TaxID=55785 RepID=A0AC35F9G0_9BILA